MYVSCHQIELSCFTPKFKQVKKTDYSFEDFKPKGFLEFKNHKNMIRRNPNF